MGKFWAPGRQEQLLPGTLSITDGGEIRLTLLVDQGENWFFSEKPDSIPRIVGVLDGNQGVTLDGCFVQSVQLLGLGRATVYVGMAMMGFHFEGDEPIDLVRFQFTIEGLDEWLQISGFKLDYDRALVGARVEFSRPPSIEASLTNGMTLRIGFGATFPGRVLNSAEIRQSVAIDLLSDHPRPLEDFRIVSHRLTQYLRLALDAPVSLADVKGIPGIISNVDDKSSRPHQPTDIYYRSLPFSAKAPTIKIRDILFGYSQVQDQFQSRINSWLDHFDRTHVVFSSYFSSVAENRRFLEDRFLAMIIGLEGYHRSTTSDTRMPHEEFERIRDELLSHCPPDHRTWLEQALRHSNDPTLRTRLKTLIRPFKGLFGNSRSRDSLIDDMVTLRNSMIHLGGGGQEATIEKLDRLRAINKLEALFQLHLLLIAGFNVEEVEEIARRQLRLKQKLDLKT